MKIIAENKMFGGVQRVYEHNSTHCNCPMRFGVYLPPQIVNQKIKSAAALFWLSGLTCTEQNFITKSGAQRVAAELGLILVAPDTSPRGDKVPDDEQGAYDFGLGAGFYVDATQAPWAEHYQMYSYITDELPAVLSTGLPIDMSRLGISGHSMGGHGALTLHLKNPQLFKTVSALAPIVAPSQVPWGQKALSNYLGNSEATWHTYDAVALIEKSASEATLLVDQGSADEFLQQQLRPELLQAACDKYGQGLVLNYCSGYDHSYFFIASFIEKHLRHHHQALTSL